MQEKIILDKTVSIFLDFDGVTHIEKRDMDVKLLFSKLPLIVGVLKMYEEVVEVVISSSWRNEYSLEAIKNLMPDISHMIVGATPNLKKPDFNWTPAISSAERQAECLAWLKLNRFWDQGYIFIDDRGSWFEPDCRQLLLTNGSTGFTPEDSLQLHAMIKEYL